MSSNPILPPHCPSCGATMLVVKLECPVCSTEVTGDFELCPVCRLNREARRLFEFFMQARGNLKEVQRILGLSYPTTRLRIEELFRQMGQGPSPPSPGAILKRVRAGEITVGQAARLLRGELPRGTRS